MWQPFGGDSVPGFAIPTMRRRAPVMDERTELAWLRERVGGLERSLFATRRELFDCRARLALITRIVQEGRRGGRPVVVLGAIRAAVAARPQDHPASAERLRDICRGG